MDESTGLDSITDALRARAEEQSYTMFVGPDVVVELKKSAQATWWSVPDEQDSIAARAYNVMRKTTRDQSIVLLGQSGTGKSAQKESICRELVSLGVRPKVQRLANAIKSLHVILSAFGNASTPTNDESTRFTHYLELQFTPTDGFIDGCKSLLYAFESSRVASHQSNESNFHLLHWLSPVERRLLRTTTARRPRYDPMRVESVKDALRQTGFAKDTVNAIFLILEAILRLGDLSFQMNRSVSPDSAAVENVDVLEQAANFLHVSPSELEQALTNQTTKNGSSTCSVFLNARAAAKCRDRFISTLYGALVDWINEQINARLTRDEFGSYVAIVDPSTATGLPDLVRFSQASVYDRIYFSQMSALKLSLLPLDGAKEETKALPFVNVLCSVRPPGLIELIAKCSKESELVESVKDWSIDPSFKVLTGASASFICTHWNGPATYEVEEFFAHADSSVSAELVELFQRAPAYTDEESPILLLRKLLKTKTGKALKRAPSRRNTATSKSKTKTAVKEADSIQALHNSVSVLLDNLDETRRWTALCVQVNDVDGRDIRRQAQYLQILAIIGSRTSKSCLLSMPFIEFWERYGQMTQLDPERAHLDDLPYHQKFRVLATALGLSPDDVVIGADRVSLTYEGFARLEGALAEQDANERERAEMQSRVRHELIARQKANQFSDSRSIAPSTAWSHAQTALTPRDDLFSDIDNHATKIEIDDAAEEKETPTTIEKVKLTASRKRWVALTWALTFWIPSFMLSLFGRMKRSDVRMAWREKLVIKIGKCPKEYVYSKAELGAASFYNDPGNMLVAIRGEIFDLTSFAPLHQPGANVIPTKSISIYGGQDVTDLFPVQVSSLCNGVTGSVSPWVRIETKNKTIEPNARYHDFRATSSDSRPDWYFETMIYLRSNFRRGFVGVTGSEVKKRALAGNTIVIYEDSVYDLTDYVANDGGGLAVPDGQAVPGNTDRTFLSPEIVALFQAKSGQDITVAMNNLKIGSDVLARQRTCLRNLFYVGKVDTRNSAQCQFSRYILLAISVLMMSVVGFKFFASLQFSRSRRPEDPDKFIICQVPCYTEGEESLRACIESLTRLKYDDKRKLIFIVVDGMVVGSGNDKPTSEIVLDILGVTDRFKQEPLSFLSIGEGAKQHNMGKVFSGLFEASGHIVPFVVVVKCGKATEKRRPGNRGKRDSQMLMMRFLNRVHYDAPMSPLELELFHHMKNIIGVPPSYYEYILQVDADTTVDPYGLNYLVSACVEDKRIIGICGETSLKNARASWTTMMQVYEYFISHYLSKAFESLFGAVTCLPGCFSMYRIRTLEGKPLIVNDAIIEGYGLNRVDTLHLKNLLSLGEDRYLTTLMMKTFPNFKLKFRKEAKAQTLAPDDWRILVSQRRRWINSTIHNLVELLWIDRMCGVCCFSMRFVVFVDLASTIVAPVTVAYIAYLVYLVAAEHKAIPLTALIMLSVVYGLQALVFILHRKFEHIGWMLIYILAIPLFSFVLPLTSFWRMDDFTWGSTREVTGEKGKKIIVHEEGEFDPGAIPLKTWRQFEQELWDSGSNESIGEILAARDRRDSKRASSMMYPPGQQPPVDYFAPRSVHAASMYSLPYESTQRGESMGSLAPLMPPSSPALSMAGGRASTPLARPTRSPELAPGQLPDEDVLMIVVQTILASSDLEKVTKRDVREQIETMYSVILSHEQKDVVNGIIGACLGL